MKERPILFSASMVRAIPEGRKTQTRRIVKPQPLEGRTVWQDEDSGQWLQSGYGEVGDDGLHCPYGQPGDQLWVRESFSGPWCMEKKDGCAAVPPSRWGRSSHIWYWADGEPDHGDWTKPRPSIHMPRWASRITLEITGVRVERLQEISEADAIAEGIEPHYAGWMPYGTMFYEADGVTPANYFRDPRDSYRTLWNSINGPGSWDANPFVWCIEFRRIASGEDLGL